MRMRGLEWVDAAARKRWLQVGKDRSPYLLQERSLLWDRDRWRMPTPVECERLTGFPDNYTAPPVVQPFAPFEREQFLGNAMHVGTLQ